MLIRVCFEAAVCSRIVVPAARLTCYLKCVTNGRGAQPQNGSRQTKPEDKGDFSLESSNWRDGRP
jgi:hypothetical protein